MNNQLLAGAGTPSLDGYITNPALGTMLNVKLTGGGDATFLSSLISTAIGYIFILGGVAFFFMLIWGAVSWILSGGDKAHIENAKGRITNALLGLILLFSSIAIAKLIEKFFNIDILSIDIGPLFIQ